MKSTAVVWYGVVDDEPVEIKRQTRQYKYDRDTMADIYLSDLPVYRILVYS